MQEIRGDAKTIRQLLSGSKYTIDYYQREYRWQKKHVTELIDDLFEKFSASFEEAHERHDVADYANYFLGSIIVSNRDGQKYLVDGQQRLTTLTLLLIHLNHLLGNMEDAPHISELIFSERYGQRSFNLDIPERNECMDALYRGEPFDESNESESVRNIIKRYADIEEYFPEELDSKSLPYFVDWLIENVYLVEITTYSDADAYLIFETMNDRGLSLRPTDMLKGYLLANIANENLRTSANTTWKERVDQLRLIGNDEEADAIKAWLRSQHAKSIRERRRAAEPGDFDLIGTEFHRWVRSNESRLGLHTGSDFATFIERDFKFYSHWYKKLRMAAEKLDPDLKCVYYNAQHNFTLQYPVLLSPLNVGNPPHQSIRKIQVTAAYIDILIHRRIWNFRAINYSTLQYAMFLVMRDIRGKNTDEVAELLYERLKADENGFVDTQYPLRMHSRNGRQIHRTLARMTDYVETCSGLPSRYLDYIQRGGKDRYEVEHIWANHPEWYEDEFEHPSDFDEYRSRIGGLVLLPKRFNASFGDLPFQEKRKHYLGQNLLARSLHEDCYERNPGFLQFIRESGLPFRSHTSFRKADLDVRQELYQSLAARIWDPERLLRMVD